MLYDNSRYVRSSTYIDTNGTTVFSTRQPHTFTASKGTVYRICLGDTLDGLAYKFFGMSSYYWAILDCNPSLLHELNLTIGDTIIIPSKDEVLAFYGR